jgi:hypothetical protein
MINQYISEAFGASKGKTTNGKNIIYIDPSKPENKETFKYKDVLKNHGAEWSQSLKFRNIFPPHRQGFWFWFIGDSKDQQEKAYKYFIEPALKQIHGLEGATSEESEASLIDSVNALISDVQTAPTTATGEEGGITPQDKEEVQSRLLKFKETLVNLDTDEEYKETMRIILAFKNAQGHPYSFINSILIWLQNKNATFVLSPTRWANYNRTVNKDAKSIIVRSPSKAALRPYSKQEKQEITDKFVKQAGKNNYNDLTIGEKDELGVQLRGAFGGKRFEFTEAFDIKDTTPIPGKEDYAAAIQKKGEIKWYDEGMTDEKVKPIYGALESYVRDLGITINYVSLSSLGGARGSSGAGGVITMPENEGNDVGLTKTLAHEASHSLLHQKYVSTRNTELSKYFLGTEEGREVVEQQAELAAWLVMGLFGFDLKTASINYIALWGADKEAMVKVYDTVTTVVNLIVDEINKRLGQKQPVSPTQGISEDVAGVTPAKHITPMDIAHAVGNVDDYTKMLKKTQLVERYYKLVRK